ncbi:hypothetical protein O7632_26945 [Solwaraspora sp. WMMD406]|uniref:hypothetical protein n=1 Tax=Solwaraspora sp. WMMD406 TaxID=3016095 RepID=UPI0024163359|nr:hypothetical protein [Solwaraspora sp. WMMD406]MDG4767703.1 hypothetical protein [Solwaraspora sp. WMMD406]
MTNSSGAEDTPTRRTRAAVAVGVVVLLLLAVVAVTVWQMSRRDSAGPAAGAPAPSASPSDAVDGDTDTAGAAVQELLITPEGIGDLRIGESIDELRQAGTLDADPGGCPEILAGRDELTGVIVYTAASDTAAGDTAALIFVDDPPLATDEGIAVGSTSAALRAAYGDRLVQHTAANNPYAENYLVSDGTAAIGFVLSQDAVSKVLVAPTDVLRNVFDAGEFHC